MSLVFVLPCSARGASPALQQGLEKFQSGSYNEALRWFSQAPAEEQLDALYWKSQSLFKLQRFEEAARGFEQVVQQDKGRAFPAATYYLGQSYYSTQDFRKALPAFEQAAAWDYKPAASLYYIGFIQGLLEQDLEALKTFQKVFTLKGPEVDAMRQPTMFQVAEVYSEMAERSPDKKLSRSIYLKRAVPTYERVIAMNEKHFLSPQAQARIIAIHKKLGIDIPRTDNGSARPAKSWVVRLGEDFKYDSNVINEPEGRIVKVSNTGSPLLKTAAFAKYEFLLWNWIALTPELAFDWTLHTRRGDSSVYSNDNTSTAPAVRGRWDHMMGAKPAAFLSEVEFSFLTRDYLGVHQQMYYSRTWNFILGERAELLSLGSTTVKFNLRFAENSNPRLSFIGPALSLSQNWLTFQRYMFNTSLVAEMQRARDAHYDQRSLRLNTSYGMPSLFWSTNVDLSLSLGMVDTVNQLQSRGYETSINPGVTLTKYIDDASHFAVSFNYSFTKQFSKDEAAYAYAKHIVGLGVQVTF